ncbi:copper chaperone PCu(A)C [Altererythrobacter sp. MF3-039]|uniref:copper chaperone PCu(A)C n=1 Tax=Altererythrobacter sp. MF3-039 TaxID=3252901 RepID=UPI00390CAF81
MKRSILASAALGFAAIGMAACSDEAPVEQAAPEGIPGLRITNGRMVLNAVEGNPAAVYFNLEYDGDRGLAIRSASVAGAESAMLHEYADNRGVREMMEALPITLKNGTKLAFEPGSRHVMATGVSPELKSGDNTEVTLTVSGGDSITFPVTVQAAGESEA